MALEVPVQPQAPDVVDRLSEPGPDPSYPSEHAAIAGAASRVLAYLFPERPALRLDEGAEQAADSRVQAGANWRSDVEAGLELGRKVAEQVIAHARADGSDRRWDGRRPGPPPRFWAPPPGSTANPVQPLAGTWKTWVMSSGSQLRPGPPPVFGSPQFLAQAREMVEVKNNLTEDQKEKATFWAGGQGTPLPAGVWNNVILAYVRDRKPSEPQAERVMSLVNVAMADAGVAAWDAKFTYWDPRPPKGVRDSGVDPNWVPFIDTPFFPPTSPATPPTRARPARCWPGCSPRAPATSAPRPRKRRTRGCGAASTGGATTRPASRWGRRSTAWSSNGPRATARLRFPRPASLLVSSLESSDCRSARAPSRTPRLTRRYGPALTTSTRRAAFFYKAQVTCKPSRKAPCSETISSD